MKIRLDSFSLAPCDAGVFLKSTFGLTFNQINALTIIEQWESGALTFKLTTSGSTDMAKEVQLSRGMLIWSANNTKEFLNLEDHEEVLCCLPVNKVGGFMMLIRSLIFGWDVTIAEPTSDPFENGYVRYSFVSLVPYQLYQIMQHEKSLQKLKFVNVILIGGAELRSDAIQQMQNWPGRVYQSYGMTETASHIALKNINQSIGAMFFSVLPGVEIKVTENSLLQISIPRFEISLATKDKAALHSGGLEILGREEFFINSGGWKLNAFEMEEFVSVWFKDINDSRECSVIGQTDSLLGEKIVLFITGKPLTKEIESVLKITIEKQFGKYLMPKEIRYLTSMPLVNFKVDRKFLKEY